jgi:divalent metal cation (Fe/Co/Zn/Cd) transporter
MLYFLISFWSLLVAKLSGVFVSLLMLGLANFASFASAAEIADAPIPEPNYVGILVFLGLFVGVGAWFMWKVMTKKGDGDQK